jgi:hypothetical protein
MSHVIFMRIGCALLTYDMYMCHLRHINDPVLSSLKMEDISFFCEYCRMSPSVFDYVVQGYTTAHFTHINKFSENNILGRKTVRDTEASPTFYTFNTLYSFP